MKLHSRPTVIPYDILKVNNASVSHVVDSAILLLPFCLSPSRKTLHYIYN